MVTKHQSHMKVLRLHGLSPSVWELELSLGGQLVEDALQGDTETGRAQGDQDSSALIRHFAIHRQVTDTRGDVSACGATLCKNRTGHPLTPGLSCTSGGAPFSPFARVVMELLCWLFLYCRLRRHGFKLVRKQVDQAFKTEPAGTCQGSPKWDKPWKALGKL